MITGSPSSPLSPSPIAAEVRERRRCGGGGEIIFFDACKSGSD